ncbi:hypothetical protein [Magnetospira thiophila]
MLFLGGGVSLVLGSTLAGLSLFGEGRPILPVFAAVFGVNALVMLVLGMRLFMRGRIVTVDPLADRVSMQGLGRAAAEDFTLPLSAFETVTCRRDGHGFRVELTHPDSRFHVPLLLTMKMSHAQVRQQADALARALGKPVRFS